jgi:hypothetical protein
MRSGGLDTLQRLIGVPQGSLDLSSSGKVEVSLSWSPLNNSWSRGEKDKAVTAGTSRRSHIIDGMIRRTD